jgi:hypothetical protein
LHNSCDASCITLDRSPHPLRYFFYCVAVSFLLFIKLCDKVSMSLSSSTPLSTCEKEKTFYLERPRKKINYIPFKKETKNVFIFAHTDAKRAKNVVRRKRMTFFPLLSLCALLCKTSFFHESCRQLILWDTSFYSLSLALTFLSACLCINIVGIFNWLKNLIWEEGRIKREEKKSSRSNEKSPKSNVSTSCC